MASYNSDLWKENFRNVFWDIQYEVDVLIRFLKYNLGLGRERIKSWLWIWFGAGILTPLILQS
jgi:hypothetical protein